MIHFAYPLPWWLALIVVVAILGLAYAEYSRPLAPLGAGKRGTLAGCRALVLVLLALFLFRPTVLVPPTSARDAVVAILVDKSLSMRLTDADGRQRFARATSLVRGQLWPALSQQYAAEIYTVGERIEPFAIEEASPPSPDGRASDLAGAIRSVRDRLRGQPIAGIVLLTDGADTAQSSSSTSVDALAGVPIFAVGIGSSDSLRDREVTGLTPGVPRVDQATVDLHVTVTSAGFGRSPFLLRVLANGREIESRRLAPSVEGAPLEAVFTVAPEPAAPTVYTAEIAGDGTDAIAENNTRSVLVNPAGRRRRLLMIEGAPGFEHSFIRRAWSRDPGLEIDTVGRKGTTVDGQSTFFVQAAPARSVALARGFPASRADLFAYDAIILANVEADLLTRDQLAMLAEFVSGRGGGLLVVGGRSFAARGLNGTPIEDALPIELSDRRGGVLRASASADRLIPNKVSLTTEGEQHPVMRVGGNPEDTRRIWSALPTLASTSPVGGPKPGAVVLAVTASPTGVVYPVVAVQRYGRGRSMTFSGEASWRWKMLLPSSDRSFEFFWRQAARWLSGDSPDPVSMTVTQGAAVGDAVIIDVDARDAVFAPALDAMVEASVTPPGRETRPLVVRASSTGLYTAGFQPDQPGLYRVAVEARRAGSSLGSAVGWLHVGGVEREFADPRLNEAWLRRVARASGGRYVRPPDVSKIASWLQETTPRQQAPERRDLWHEPLAFAAVIVLLSAEWILRRRWGLR